MSSSSQFSKEIEFVTKHFGNAFSPVEVITGTTDALSERDVFVWCDELLLVDSAYSSKGVVRHLDGSMASNNWIWNFQGEPSYKLGTITEESLNSLIKA